MNKGETKMGITDLQALCGRPREKVKGWVMAVVVEGGMAQAKDAVVWTCHKSRAAADKMAAKIRAGGSDVHVEWADEFVAMGGMIETRREMNRRLDMQDFLAGRL